MKATMHILNHLRPLMIYRPGALRLNLTDEEIWADLCYGRDDQSLCGESAGDEGEASISRRRGAQPSKQSRAA